MLDIIVGMEWMELPSPMEVHCHHKWMPFIHQGKRIKIQGLTSENMKLNKISVSQIDQLEQDDEIGCILEVFSIKPEEIKQEWPREIKQLINQFEDIFAKPQGLPPKRAHAHSIPFIAGAQPFRMRPYRYNPAQKNEIEKQVSELLKNGMIRESSSPFASPVLLVKK